MLDLDHIAPVSIHSLLTTEALSLCANMNETASITPVQYEGDEVNHHDDHAI